MVRKKPTALRPRACVCLPFLAAGETHKSAKKYKETVSRGLNYLKGQIKPSGELDQNMYAHAIATIALCEAAGMTGDDGLKKIAQNRGRVCGEGSGGQRKLGIHGWH